MLIRIVDVQEPPFPLRDGRVNVSESAAPGGVVATVHVGDPDWNSNVTIRLADPEMQGVVELAETACVNEVKVEQFCDSATRMNPAPRSRNHGNLAIPHAA